jgi:hypothetical protein
MARPTADGFTAVGLAISLTVDDNKVDCEQKRGKASRFCSNDSCLK